MIILSVLALLPYATITEAQFSSRFDVDNFNPFPSGFGIFPSSFNPFPNGFPKFPEFPDFSGFFGSNWIKELEEKITAAVDKASGVSGIEKVNGTTVITQTIGGRKYTATVPEGSSYSLSTRTETINGKTVSIVKLTIDGKTSVYTTEDGKTTVTDGEGKPLTNGGFFGVEETSAPQVTDAPEPTEPPESNTAGPESPESTAAPVEAEGEKTTLPEELKPPEPSQNPENVENVPTTTVAPDSEANEEKKEAEESNSITSRVPTRGDRV